MVDVHLDGSDENDRDETTQSDFMKESFLEPINRWYNLIVKRIISQE